MQRTRQRRFGSITLATYINEAHLNTLTHDSLKADIETAPPPTLSSSSPGLTVVSLSALALAACGGGSDGGAAPAPAPGPSPGAPLTRAQASRMLSQAAFGGTATEIDNLKALGQLNWLQQQFDAPRSSTHVEWMRANGYETDGNDGRVGVERSMWRKLISSPDLLRQRVVLALSEIFVISIIPVTLPWRGFAVAAFVDILEANAFGNYRDLLLQVSTCSAMGSYLTYLNSVKANPTTGSMPDENYARELMQLFSIGVLKLNLDGTPVIVDGVAQETYTQSDVSQLARVFTGWGLDTGSLTLPSDAVIRPMKQRPTLHESGPKTFLGTTIPANTDGVESLKRTIDTLMAHPNIGPFISRQLIQRLVTSNPSPAYVARVATAFNGDGTRPKGDMKATLIAVLTDVEATSSEGLTAATSGKVREPVMRFLQWARTFGLKSPDNQWNIGDLSNTANELGQSPLRSPTVFNFFRPGYVPPNTALGTAKITAPELQITTESTVAGYINFMQNVVSNGIGGMQADYSAWMPLVGNSAALLTELNTLLAAGQLSDATVAKLKVALDSIDTSTTTGQLNRLYAALTLVLAAPEYLVQK